MSDVMTNEVALAAPSVSGPGDGEREYLERFDQIWKTLEAIPDTLRRELNGELGAVEIPAERVSAFAAIKALILEFGATIKPTGDLTWTTNLMIAGERDFHGNPAHLAIAVDIWRCPETGAMIGSLEYEEHIA